MEHQLVMLAHSGLIPATSKCFFPLEYKVVGEKVMIKLHDLASSSIKNKALARPSMGECLASARHGNINKRKKT